LTDRTLADIGFVGGLVNFADNSGTFDITQAEVPEPGTTTVLILFLSGMAVAQRRISKKLG
jgi:hypothetical protein